MDRAHWTKALREAEAELEAAKALSAVNAAAKKVMHAEAELKQLEAEAAQQPKRRPSRGAEAAGASS
jgi:hypothetical protein